MKKLGMILGAGMMLFLMSGCCGSKNGSCSSGSCGDKGSMKASCASSSCCDKGAKKACCSSMKK